MVTARTVRAQEKDVTRRHQKRGIHRMALPGAFSLQDASLISGIEPLPLSSPTSPRRSLADSSSPPPPVLYSPSAPSHRRSYSSEVSAQLYASLRRSREAGQAQDSGPGTRGPPPGSALTSDMDDLAQEMSRRLQEGVEASGAKEPSPYISQMESLRCHLKNMLTLQGNGPEKNAEQQSDSTSALLNSLPGQDLSPPLSLTGLEGLFPRYSTLYNAAPSLSDLHLRDALEKETARRKHLERHIQSLQNDMLELQQRVSVTLAADRRKDAMIQQLDQTLATVVGGWKQQEQEREETVRRLRQEKEDAQQARAEDREALSQVRQELAQTQESLNREKTSAEEKLQELLGLVEEQTAWESRLKAQREAEEEAREGQRAELEALRRQVQELQKSWEEREQELQEESRRMQEESRRELEKEKALTQQETQKSQQWQLAIAALQGDVSRLERELQSSHRERDTLQMELNLEKARNESEKVRMESEHKVRLEEAVSERLSALHQESAQHLCAVREQHRRHLLDLTSQHEAELSNQLSQFKSEFQERERRHREVIMEYELKLSHSDERCQELSRALRRLETEKAQKLSQLQDVMKSHWNQALQVLSAQASLEGSPYAQPNPKTDPGGQWTYQRPEDGRYSKGDDHSSYRDVGAGDSTTYTNQHLKESTGSHTATDRSCRNISSAARLDPHAGHHAGDSAEAKQSADGSSRLAQSSGSDLINFSQGADDPNQNLFHSGHLQEEPSLRFAGCGPQIGDKANNDNNNIGGQSILDCSQSGGNMRPPAKDWFNSGHLQVSGLDEYHPNTDSNTSNRYMLGNLIKEPYSQSVVVSGHNSSHTGFEFGSSLPRNTAGHSVTDGPSQLLLVRDTSQNRGIGDHFIEGIHQSGVSRQNCLAMVDGSQLKDYGGLSFATTNRLPSSLSVYTNNQDHEGHNARERAHRSMVDSSRSAFVGRHLAPAIVPHLGNVAKESFQGLGSEFRSQSGYEEESTASRKPSQRNTDSEDSFYPMQMEELSHSFASHLGFYPLEPHPDGSIAGTVSTTLPQTSPEHPFQEEPSLNSTGIPPNWKADEDRVAPNPVLQYYIRMLLDRAPGDPLNEMDKGLTPENPDVTELCQYLMSKGNQSPHRLEEKKSDVSKLPANPKKHPENKAAEAVKKEVLSCHRRSNPSRPLKRVSSRGGRPAGIWK